MCYPIPITVQEKWASKVPENTLKICFLCGAEVSVKTQIAICWQESSVQSGFNYFRQIIIIYPKSSQCLRQQWNIYFSLELDKGE